MDRHVLTDAEWNAIRRFFPKERTGKRGRPWCSHRQVVNGVLWVLAVGAPWRDLPSAYGNWSTVYKRFCRWRKSGLWDRIFESVLRRVDRTCGIDDSLWCIDGSIIRAHRCAGGSRSNEPEEPENHALGRSQGGFGTKVHLISSGCGIPLAFVLTPGQQHESTVFETLLSAVPFGAKRKPLALAGDKAYSSNAIRRTIAKHKMKDVIPTKSNEKRNPRFSKSTYKRRNIVERVFGWLKENRRIATRYDKQSLNYLAFLKIASVRMMLEWL